MAECNACGKDMLVVDDCSAFREIEFADGKKLAAIPYPEDEEINCHDCGVGPGKYHHPGCDMAECPRCGGQVIFCECKVVA